MSKLGTYISTKDMEKILSRPLGNLAIVKSYFSSKELMQQQRIIGHITDLTSYLFQSTDFPYPVIVKSQETMLNSIPKLKKIYAYVSKLRILLHYLACLDNLLEIGLSVKEFNLIKKDVGFGNSKEFSFMSMRYKQRKQKRGLIESRVKEGSS